MEELNTFLLAFGGQLVTITTSVVVSDENQSILINYEGILLEHDQDFVYLGQTVNEITDAVQKSKVLHIGLKNEVTVLDEIFENMPDPKEGEFN